MNYFIFIWLSVCSFIDIKKRQLPWILLWIGALGSICLAFIQIINGKQEVWNCFIGAMLGIILLIFSKASGEQIGSGDGIVFFITGIALGGIKNFVLLAASLFLTCIISLVLLLLKKVNRKTAIPFLPFIWCSFLLEWLCKNL